MFKYLNKIKVCIKYTKGGSRIVRLIDMQGLYV